MRHIYALLIVHEVHLSNFEKKNIHQSHQFHQPISSIFCVVKFPVGILNSIYNGKSWTVPSRKYEWDIYVPNQENPFISTNSKLLTKVKYYFSNILIYKQLLKKEGEILNKIAKFCKYTHPKQKFE